MNRGNTTLVRGHRALIIVLAVAAVVRVGAAVAYWPALYYFDSFAYLNVATGGEFLGVVPDRPSGYPLAIKLLSPSGSRLELVTLVQHAAGLVAGVLVYALLLRLGVRRWLAAVAAAVVMFDGYAIALEQEIMPEAFFTTLLLLSVYLVVGGDRGPVALGASGLLLGAAATFRTVALFAIPVWVLYVVWAHRRVRAVSIAAAGLAVPLLAYGGFHYYKTDQLGFTQAEGWFLYARIGQIGECGNADIPTAGRRLCARTDEDRGKTSAYFMWHGGPANRVFGGLSEDPDRQERSNRVLREFALTIIRDRPLRYAGIVAEDFLRYFRPGVPSEGNSDLAMDLPDGGPRRAALLSPRDPGVERRQPVYRPRVSPPARVMHRYGLIVHTPRWLLAALVLLVVVALALAAYGPARDHFPRRREVFLLAGWGLAMLLGTVATHEYNLRYLIPAVPLLVAAGVLAATDLYGLARLARSTPSEGSWAPLASGSPWRGHRPRQRLPARPS